MLNPEEDKYVEELLRSDNEETSDKENVPVNYADEEEVLQDTGVSQVK